MKVSRLPWVFVLIGILLMSVVSPMIDFADAAVPSGFTDTLVASGLNLPTAMEFSPDGRIFVSEKGGNLRIVKNGALLATPFASLPVNSQGERGLLGIAFDPNFASNRYVYVYYVTSASPIHSKVVRLTADSANPDRALPGSEVTILDLEPQSTESHVAGGLEFGPDGKLYISVGENYYPYNSQSLTSRFGKILRINADGTIPTDNPFYNVSGAYKEIWALGLRNPFSFQFSNDGTKMYIADVGQNSWEEVNQGLRGANYGWPTCEGMCNDPRYIDPIYTYPTSGGGAIVSGPFYDATQFPSEYMNNYFFGDYVQGFIKRLTPTNQVVNFATALNSPVAIEVGPDGSLFYLSIGSGQLRKITYGTPGPTALATANPTSGPSPLTVNFSGAGSSSSPSGGTLTYSWNFGDGSSASGVSVSHTYASNGSYTARLTVTDSSGRSGSDTVGITVGSRPVATISAPASGATYSAGNTISFSGSATDAEDGTLPASAFRWTVLFHHNTHIHPFQEFNGVRSGSFTIPTVGETDSDVWYRIYLTVTDSDGLTHTVTRDILPKKSTIRLATSVSGLQLLLDGQPHTTPYSFVGVVGVSRTLEGPSTQTFSGRTYNFESWSDGGSRIHNISTPASDTTFTATYTDGGSAPSTRTLTVNSAEMSGSPHSGFYTTIYSGTTLVHAGYTPVTFTGNAGATYSVVVHDYGGSTFDHWENGSTERTRVVTLNNNMEITAFYRTSTSAPPSSYNLSVRSADMSGNTISGYYTVIESGGSVVHTGYTPVTYIGEPGGSYTVTVQDFGQSRFDHWENGSTSRTRTITLNSNVIMTAYYSTSSSPSSYTLTVASADMSGNAISGYYTTVSSGGSVVQSGFTPLTFTGTPGATYTVSVSDYGNHAFDHWENSSTTRARTLTLNADTAITAYYRDTSSVELTVNSVNMSGNPITGYYTTISSGGTTVQSGFTPLSFTGTPGTMYTVSIQDYGDFVFDHWENGSTTRARTLTLNADTTVTASYRNTAAPVLTVRSADMSGNTITGYYATVYSGASAVATGFTPFTFTGSSGTTYTVSVADYGSYVFDHWENGSTTRARTLTLNSNTDVTAHYRNTATRTLTVTSADMSGNPITGYYTTVYSGGSVVATGFTPFTFTGNAGATYAVSVADYGSYVFDHWGNGSTTRLRTVTLNSDTFFEAFYRNTG